MLGFDIRCRERRLGRRLGKDDRERRALSRSGAVYLHAAAVQLDQVPHDREAESDAALALAAADILRLPEALEHVRQELRRDALAGVADDDPHLRALALEAELDPSAARRELDGVRE